MRGPAIARQLIESALTDMNAKDFAVLVVSMTGHNEDCKN